MPWTFTSYLEHRAKELRSTNPKVLLFFNAFFGFAAGAQLIYELEEGSRSTLGIVLAVFMVALWLGMSLECSYFLLRAIRRNQARSDSES